MGKKMIWGMLVVLVISLAGCGGRKGEPMEETSRNAANELMYDEAAGFTMEAKEAETSTPEESVQEEPAEPGSSQNDKVQQQQSADLEKKLIRTVNLGIETEYFDDIVSDLNQVCKQLQGYVGNSSLDNVLENRTYNIEMRIPQEHLDEFLNHVSSMGNMRIRYKHENTKDVTLDYFDSAEHKKSLEVERDRILELIAQADSLEYVVSLEDKLSDLRYMISSYESQLRRMDNQVSYSTVTVEIEEVKQITVEKTDTVGERISSGFRKTVTDIKDGFLNFVVWFVTQLPRLLIFAIVIFIGIKVSRKIYRKWVKQNNTNEK